MTGILRRWWPRLGPRRTIWPTRDGWWCLGVALGLGVAAVNTGNNLVYLLCSMLLALILVSGMLSEQSMRGLRLTVVLPEEVYAGRPALFGAIVANRKRRLPSYSITLETSGPGGDRCRLHLPRLAAGDERVVTWQASVPARGRHKRLADLADQNAIHLLETLRLESFEGEERADDPVYALGRDLPSTLPRAARPNGRPPRLVGGDPLEVGGQEPRHGSPRPGGPRASPTCA